MVMTLNLRFGRADDGPDNWENRKQRYASFFQEYRPDFLGMQEANAFQVEFIQQHLAEYDCIGQRIPSPPYWQDNVIFYRREWECAEAERFFFSHTPSIPSRFPESRWPRQCIYGRFQKNGQQVVCVNTHFDFLPAIQTKSAEMIVERMSSFPAATCPVVITGDFNSLPDSPGYREFVNHGGFQEVFQGAYTGTHHNFSGTHTGRHIDWILYRGPLELTDRKKITRRYQGGYPSDHFPILAEFRITDSGL